MNIKDDPKLATVDFSNAKPVAEVPALAKLQAKRRAEREEVQQRFAEIFDSDVITFVLQHANDPVERSRINGVLRGLILSK